MVPMVSPGVFTSCHVFTQGDLPIFFKDALGNPINPYKVTFSLYLNQACGPVLVGCKGLTPVNVNVGEYYAQGVSSYPGDWFVEWVYQETVDSPPIKVIFPFKVFDTGKYCPKCCGTSCGCPSGW